MHENFPPVFSSFFPFLCNLVSFADELDLLTVRHALVDVDRQHLGFLDHLQAIAPAVRGGQGSTRHLTLLHGSNLVHLTVVILPVPMHGWHGTLT